MDEEESNLQDTINADMKNRNQDHGALRKKIEKEAKKEAKKAAKKAKKKLKETLFKKVGLPAVIGVLPLLIIVFMIVGIISFVTSMPGLVQEEIMSKLMDIKGGFKYWANGSDQYLVDLAENSDQTNQKEILMYLDDMGIDPVGFGFAAFYTRKTYKDSNNQPVKSTDVNDISYETNIDIDKDVKKVSGFISAIGYNNAEVKKRLKEDLVLKYLISNERTYLIHDNDKFGNTSIGSKVPGLDKLNLSGMIVTKIDGIDDSEITVDRENKQMVITSKNWGFLSVTNQVARYNLESWSGRYGMSLEFLLALHIGTMTSDLTDEMLSNENLQTTMYVASKKGDYDVDYEIKYKGQDLPIKRGKVGGGFNDSLTQLFSEDTIYQKPDGTYGVTLTEDDLKGEVTISSLYWWLHSLRTLQLRPDISGEFISMSAYDAKDALLGEDEFRVVYRMQADNYGDAYNWRFTSYYGPAEKLDDGSYSVSYWKPDYKDKNGEEIKLYNKGSPDVSENYTRYDGVQVRYYRVQNDQTEDETVFISTPDPEIYEAISTGSWNLFRTGIIHGLEYYLDGHELEVKQDYVKLGIASVLSQIDSSLHRWQFEKMTTEEFQFQLYGLKQYDNDNKDKNMNDYITSELYRTDRGDNPQLYLMITDEWLEFWKAHPDPTQQELHDELQLIYDKVHDCFEIIDHRDQILEDIKKDMMEKAGLQDILTIDDITIIYEALENNSDDFEFVLPRIKSVVRHWYKDVIFDAAGYDAYEEVKTLRYPMTLPEENKDLEVTAVLTFKGGSFHGDGPHKQIDEPLVVKGDIVTLNGEIYKDNKGVSTDDVLDYRIDGYNVGDGYRTTKKLFTQGQYYTYDGSRETARSIWYAKQLEKLNGSDAIFAKAYVQNGRLILSWVYDGTSQPAEFNGAYLGGNNWDTSKQLIYDERVGTVPKNAVKVADVSNGEGDWSVFLSLASVSTNTDLPVNVYYIVCNSNMEYISPVDVNDVQESKDSVKRINALLEAMGVVTIRRPISFDNRTAAGDVTTLTAFGLLEGMHTEAAECIYRDLKEFLIELGYYTKAEFEQIEANKLEWFIPDYTPSTNEERKHWNQARDADNLKYGAILYPMEIDKDGNVVREGFDADLDIIAPGNCKVMETTATGIKLEFDGMSQPEIGALDRYTMIIEGLELSTTAVKVLTPDGNTATKTIADIVGQGDIIMAGEVIGKTGTSQIQVILKNRIGGYVNDVQDYMAPKSDGLGTYTTQKYQFTKDEKLLLAYVIQREAAPEGLVQYMDTKGSVYDSAEKQAMAYSEAVGYVLINRALQNYDGYGTTLKNQLEAPGQYDGNYTVEVAKAADLRGKISAGSKEAAEFCAKYGCEAVVNPDGVEMTEDVTGESAWTFGHEVFWWIDVNQNGKQDVYATSRETATAEKPYPVKADENPGNDPKLQAWPWDGYLTYTN